jgi:hypothetical protein
MLCHLRTVVYHKAGTAIAWPALWYIISAPNADGAGSKSKIAGYQEIVTCDPRSVA